LRWKILISFIFVDHRTLDNLLPANWEKDKINYSGVVRISDGTMLPSYRTEPHYLYQMPLKSTNNSMSSYDYFTQSRHLEIEHINKKFKDLEMQKINLMHKLDSIYK